MVQEKPVFTLDIIGYVLVFNVPAVLGSFGLIFATVLTLTYWRACFKSMPIVHGINFDSQSVVVKDAEAQCRAFCAAKSPDYQFYECVDSNCLTVYDVLERGKKLSDNGPCLGMRSGPNKKYKWMSYQQVIDHMHNFGSGLVHKGVLPSNETKVAIYSANRPEWIIADLGCQAFSICTVPLYDTLGLDACTCILNQCDIGVVVVDTVSRMHTLLALQPEVPTLKLIVVIEKIDYHIISNSSNQTLDLITFQDLLDLGKRYPKKVNKPKSQDLFTICYTSGTTGVPKGVMLTHKCQIALTNAVAKQLDLQNEQFGPYDVYMSYLPLPHSFERFTTVLMLFHGSRVGYWQGDRALLIDDIATLKPTIFCCVPRVLNRIYDVVMTDVKQSKIKTFLMEMAVKSKAKEIERKLIRRSSFWDKLIFSKIQNKLGGRIRLMICGSAPLSEEVMKFFRCAMGCPLLNGYGQTEITCAIALTLVGDPTVGNVGPPFPGCLIKLVDVPELNYFVHDNIGEICAKSNYVFSGYYKQPDLTAEALDKDGWLHTGDIGTWLPNGTLKIVDRKKNIFKLSQGEYVAPEKIENVYVASPFVAQCFVEGNSLKSHLMAVVVPDTDYLAKWAPKHGLQGDIKSFCTLKVGTDLVLKDMLECGKKARLQSFEQVKDIILEQNPFTVENGLLTPTFKNKRPALRSLYKSQIEALYKKHSM